MNWLRSLLLGIALRSPAPRPAPAPRPPAPTAALPLVADVIAGMNAERSARGIGPLARGARLEQFATGRAAALAPAGQLSHAGAIEGIEALFPNTFAGEDLAEGYPTAAAIVAAWMSDAGHRANVLNPRFTLVGVGLAASPHGLIAAADFDGPA